LISSPLGVLFWKRKKRRDDGNKAQNRPIFIARDFQERYGIPIEETFEILLNRGVFKWLAVRRKLFKLKNRWRDRLTKLYRQVETIKRGTPEHRELVGRIKALEECRKEIWALCHSSRFQAPDNDRHAQEFLRRKLEKEEQCR